MKWALAVVLPAGGCGTVCNLASGSPDNFGGVQRDIQFASDRGGLWPADNANAPADYNSPGGKPPGGKPNVCLLMLYGADLSLCCVADTLTLPLAMYLRQRHEGATDSAAASAN
jgi:uncharacterized protein YceK